MRRSFAWGASVMAGAVAIAAAVAIPAYPQGGAAAPASPKIGVVNLRRLFDEYQGAIQAQKDLDVKSEVKKKEIKSLEDEITKLLDTRDAIKDPKSPMKQEIEENLALKRALYEYKGKEAATELARDSARLTLLLYDEMREAIVGIGKREGYHLVAQVESPKLDTSERLSAVSQMIYHRPILYNDPALDITDQVLKEMNEAWQKRQEGGAPPGNGGK